MDKKAIIDFIDNEVSDEIVEVSHKVWEYAELSLKETKSAALYVEKLKEHGVEFDVRKVPSDSKENMDTLLQKAREGLGI